MNESANQDRPPRPPASSWDLDSLVAVNAAGCGLRLTFVRGKDRFSHRVEALAHGCWQTCLESIEGDSAEPWPASPPLQQLHFESRPPDSAVALLVGMAGKSHWSAAVETDPNYASLSFDIACRANQPPRQLGSRYTAAGRVRVQGFTARIELEHAALVAEIIPATPADGCEFVERDGELVLVCQPGVMDLPATFRWRYRLHCEPAAQDQALVDTVGIKSA